MGFSVSPSITVRETDITTTIPALATSIGGFSGYFMKGPVNERILISSEEELIAIFGQPTASNFEDWFSAKNFLSYSSNLQVIRTVGAASLNATDISNTGVQIDNEEDFDNQKSSIAGANTFIAKSPGSWGNKITVATAVVGSVAGWTYESQFPIDLTTNQVAVVVLYDNEIVETYVLNDTDTSSLDAFGTSNYLSVMNKSSAYVWIDVNNAVFTTTNTATLSALGTDVAPSVADIILGFGLFSNPQEVDVNILFHGNTIDNNGATLIGQELVDNIASVRRDCIALVSATKSDVVGIAGDIATAEITFRKTNLNINSSYGIMVDNYKYQYDKYNDQYGWVNYTGDIAGILSRTDQVAEPWFSPAGFTRGVIKNVVKSAYTPTKAQRDSLYLAGINPIVSFPGRGTVLYGDKTLVSIASAFDRINVRRLFIVLEKAIATSANNQLFEINDSFTQRLFTSTVEPFLRDVQGRRGIYDFKIIADATVNTQQVIDSNEFRASILIQPARSINFITLNFAAVKTGVDFNEILV